MSIYTKRGDQGETDLFSGERVSKTDPRIEAYGSVDELNTVLGVAESTLEESSGELSDILVALQNHLHIICANLANTRDQPDRPRIHAEHVEKLEDWIDELEEDLPPLTSFILPGGTTPASHLHHARTVCRRSERRVIHAAEQTDTVAEANVRYLNRCSDLLFVLARSHNHRHDEPERPPSYD